MAISVDQKEIILKPNLFRTTEEAQIKIHNVWGDISLNINQDNVTYDQIDSLIESLLLTRSMSEHIKRGFD